MTQQPIRKELIDHWYDLALEEVRADPDLKNDQLARAAFISNYIEGMERDYRALKDTRPFPMEMHGSLGIVPERRERRFLQI